MRFLALRVKNFMSFEEFEYIFPPSGLVFVGGEVVDGAISSSNGAGKSSVFEALCWGLYGQTIRNVSKDGIVNRHAGRDCLVEVFFEDDRGEMYTIRRFRNDTKLMNSLFFYKGERDVTGAESRATQELIDSVIQMSWIVFSTAVVFGEKAVRFAEARDSEKKQIFDEILMLQQYQEAQGAVRRDLKDLAVQVGEVETQKIVLEERFKQNTFQLGHFEEQADVLKAKQASINTEIEVRRKAVEDLSGLESSLVLEVASAKEAYESLDKADKTLYTSIQDLEKEKGQALQAQNAVLMNRQIDRAGIARHMSDLKAQKEKAKTCMPGNRCPTCGQDISEESFEEVQTHFLTEIADSEGEYAKAQAAVLETSREVDGIIKSFEKRQDEIFLTKKAMDEQLAVLQKVFRDKESELSKIRTSIQIHQSQLKSLASSLTEQWGLLQKQMDEVAKALEEDRSKEMALEHALLDLNESKNYLAFWEEGFGNTGIKSLLLDEIIPQLNTRVAFYANVLMDDELLIQFDTESMLKSKTMKDKFDVGVFRNGNRVEYASCSSGEKRRVDVAILLALQSLVFERGASSSNCVVFDEVFDSLDLVGIERVVALFHEEAKEKLIFVISHTRDLADYFEKTLIVKKKGEMSYLEEQIN